MNERVVVEVLESSRQRQRDFHSFVRGKTSALRQDAVKRLWAIRLRIDLLAGELIIGQFHHVIKVSLLPTDMKHIQLAVVSTRYGFEPVETAVFTVESPPCIEMILIDDLHRAVGAHNIAREPHLAITALPDYPEKLVVGNTRFRR
jgi:hypothetical protein